MRAHLLSFVALVPSLAAQQVWNVPAGQSVDTYIALANPGDTLVLNGTGYYAQFTVNKGVTILGNGAHVWQNPWPAAAVTFQVPAGQRASLIGVRPDGQVDIARIHVVSGMVDLSEIDFVTVAVIDIAVGATVVHLDRVTGLYQQELLVAGGFCEVVSSHLRGRNANWTYNGPSWYAAPAVTLTGGVLVASDTSFEGGGAFASAWPPFTWPSARGFVQTGGLAFLTDCTATGGAGITSQEPGQVAIAGNGNVVIARTTVTEGALATGTSSGYVIEPAMVGMRMVGTPAIGASFQTIATGGLPGGWIGIIAGFTGTLGYVSPVVEPVLNGTVQCVTLGFGGTVGHTVAVPNVASLRGVQLWLQAVQLSGLQYRASVVVGGTVR